MPNVLFIQHEEEDRPGLVGESFAKLGYNVYLEALNVGLPTPSVDGMDALVILGSKNSVYDPEVKAAWFDRELGLIGDAVAKDIPVLGICFGAQALCTFHGGTVSKAPEAEIGWYQIEPVAGSGISTGPWFEFHYDSCTTPENAEILASSERAVQAFAVGKNLAVQFHPEIDGQLLNEWFELSRDPGIYSTEMLEMAVEETPQARRRVSALVDIFLERAGLTPNA
jgi:GMP synthase-like glutamine amidotransferase